MADGTLICIGKGNEDWNYSAPHGAGRIGSRAQARKTITLQDYQKSMEGIWSSCVKESTIDEAPMAYKNANNIKEAIKETADVITHLKPIYNFKTN
jgi:RNA-splicing ligase RtcB